MNTNVNSISNFIEVLSKQTAYTTKMTHPFSSYAINRLSRLENFFAGSWSRSAYANDINPVWKRISTYYQALSGWTPSDKLIVDYICDLQHFRHTWVGEIFACDSIQTRTIALIPLDIESGEFKCRRYEDVFLQDDASDAVACGCIAVLLYMYRFFMLSRYRLEWNGEAEFDALHDTITRLMHEHPVSVNFPHSWRCDKFSTQSTFLCSLDAWHLVKVPGSRAGNHIGLAHNLFVQLCGYIVATTDKVIRDIISDSGLFSTFWGYLQKVEQAKGDE